MGVFSGHIQLPKVHFTRGINLKKNSNKICLQAIKKGKVPYREASNYSVCMYLCHNYPCKKNITLPTTKVWAIQKIPVGPCDGITAPIKEASRC